MELKVYSQVESSALNLVAFAGTLCCSSSCLLSFNSISVLMIVVSMILILLLFLIYGEWRSCAKGSALLVGVRDLRGEKRREERIGIGDLECATVSEDGAGRGNDVYRRGVAWEEERWRGLGGKEEAAAGLGVCLNYRAAALF
ncbi:hypothetical protein Droror1_Dr00020519 [Drosera rotundifolia]